MSEKLLWREILPTDPRSVIGSDGEVHHRDDTSEFDRAWHYNKDGHAEELPKKAANKVGTKPKFKSPEQIKQESLVEVVKIMRQISDADHAFAVLSDGEGSPDWHKYPNREVAAKERDFNRREANKIGKIACQNCKLINSCTFNPRSGSAKISRIISNAHVTGLINVFSADIRAGRTKNTTCSELVRNKVK